jgi:hypothetical protein
MPEIPVKFPQKMAINAQLRAPAARFWSIPVLAKGHGFFSEPHFSEKIHGI